MFADLKIYTDSFGANFYHYRDYNNKEADAVIELSNENWCAFEIKLGANQINKAIHEMWMAFYTFLSIGDDIYAKQPVSQGETHGESNLISLCR